MTLEHLLELLASVEVPGWERAVDRVNGAAVFGTPSMDGGQRRSSDGLRVVGCWFEDSETIWLSYDEIPKFGAASEISRYSLTERELLSVITALMRGEVKVRWWSRHGGTMTLVLPDLRGVRFDAVRGARSPSGASANGEL